MLKNWLLELKLVIQYDKLHIPQCSLLSSIYKKKEITINVGSISRNAGVAISVKKKKNWKSMN